jgi:hypothetical protein
MDGEIALCLSDQDINSASNRDRKADAVLAHRLAATQSEVSRLNGELERERGRSHELQQMYAQLEKKYSTLKRNLVEMSDGEDLLRQCGASPEPDMKRSRPADNKSRRPLSPAAEPEEQTPVSRAASADAAQTPAETPAAGGGCNAPPALKAKRSATDVSVDSDTSTVLSAANSSPETPAAGKDEASPEEPAGEGGEEAALKDLALQLSRGQTSAANVEPPSADEDEAA